MQMYFVFKVKDDFETTHISKETSRPLGVFQHFSSNKMLSKLDAKNKMRVILIYS